MTASKAGKLAAEGFWGTVKRLRDQWVLVVFMVTTLFWARDVYERFVDLPDRVTDLTQIVAGLRADIARLEVGQSRSVPDKSRALIFPGVRHGIGDGRRGALVTVNFAPIQSVRPECRASALDAFMIDAGGNWYSVETDLAHLPQLVGFQELAFAVKVHPRMAVGRAQFLVQVTQDCGTHLQVESSPRLHFRVLANRTRKPVN